MSRISVCVIDARSMHVTVDDVLRVRSPRVITWQLLSFRERLRLWVNRATSVSV